MIYTVIFQDADYIFVNAKEKGSVACKTKLTTFPPS
jgi:hypothetical protein